MNGRRRRWAITFLAGESPALQRPPYVNAVFAHDDLLPARRLRGPRRPEPRPLIPENVERRPRWVLDTVGGRGLVLGERATCRTTRRPGNRSSAASVPTGDDLAEAFFHLARVEELGRAAGRARALPGRVVVPRPARHAAGTTAQQGSGSTPPRVGGARFAIALTHDVDVPVALDSSAIRGAAARG